ncbi:RES family NAD+ phosphorylase [Beijerinckia sp. L45]|uniref:RES family NAD+ phosphorylase n=1 Tax=Beijerinckia sp. L45 TaxID=1641855 RepID=UPI00131D55F7|nr:RES family NAD+ phosphorylase [Beijerinckia sp. L45]
MSPPLPPANLSARTPDFTIVAAGAPIHRFFKKGFEPIFFDNSLSGRLNAPDASYGVLYGACEEAGAFAETFLRSPGRNLIDPAFLADRAYVRLEAIEDLTLVKLAGPGLAILGATAEVVHAGLPYDVPQAWSKAIRGSFAGIHGIAYHARHDDEAVCYALFDNCRGRVTEDERRVDLDEDWFWRLALRYRVGLSPT